MIILGAPRTTVDSPALPPAVHGVFSVQMQLSLYDIDTIWSCLGDISLSAGSSVVLLTSDLEYWRTIREPGHTLCTVLCCISIVLQA